MLTALVLCGVNMLLFFCRAEWRHPLNGGGRTAFCGGRRQRWWLDQSTEELGGGGICPHILHQSFPGQQCQRCHDLHMIDILSSHNLPMTFTSPIDDLYMTHRWPYYLHITWVWCRLICKYEFQMSLHEQMSDLSFNLPHRMIIDLWMLPASLCVLPVCVLDVSHIMLHLYVGVGPTMVCMLEELPLQISFRDQTDDVTHIAGCWRSFL